MQASHVCPVCGYCPFCGRGGEPYAPAPYSPAYPVYPVQPNYDPDRQPNRPYVGDAPYEQWPKVWC